MRLALTLPVKKPEGELTFAEIGLVLKKLKKGKRLERAFETSISEEVYQALKSQLEVEDD